MISLCDNSATLEVVANQVAVSKVSCLFLPFYNIGQDTCGCMLVYNKNTKRTASINNNNIIIQLLGGVEAAEVIRMKLAQNQSQVRQTQWTLHYIKYYTTVRLQQ